MAGLHRYKKPLAVPVAGPGAGDSGRHATVVEARCVYPEAQESRSHEGIRAFAFGRRRPRQGKICLQGSLGGDDEHGIDGFKRAGEAGVEPENTLVEAHGRRLIESYWRLRGLLE